MNKLPHFKKQSIDHYDELTRANESIRGGSRTAATSKMELFVRIVNGFQPLTIITKWSILDFAAVLDPPLSIFFFLAFFSGKNLIRKFDLLVFCYNFIQLRYFWWNYFLNNLSLLDSLFVWFTSLFVVST